MNEVVVKGTVASVVRWLIPLLIGWLGIQWGEDKIGEVGTAVTVFIVAMLSIWWSVREKKRLLSTPPPPNTSGD